LAYALPLVSPRKRAFAAPKPSLQRLRRAGATAREYSGPRLARNIRLSLTAPRSDGPEHFPPKWAPVRRRKCDKTESGEFGMIEALRRALGDLGDKSFRRVLVKALGLTLVLLAALGYGVFSGLDALMPHLSGWLKSAAEILASLGLVVLSIFLAMPVAALFASLFLDDVVTAVERKHYAQAPKAEGASIVAQIWAGLVFALAVIALNLLALPLYLLPLANILLFVFLNGYLIGREYFELVALRRVGMHAARALRRENRWAVLGAGTIIALALSVPIVNLLAPLFGAALMAHLFHGLAERQAAHA
jgi:uncharacterized protein involved in cysteine biosynthesis